MHLFMTRDEAEKFMQENGGVLFIRAADLNVECTKKEAVHPGTLQTAFQAA
jgi:hypothetical protein